MRTDGKLENLPSLQLGDKKRKRKTDKHIRQVNKNWKTCPTCNSVINEEDGEGAGKIWGDNKGVSGFVDSVISV